MIHYNQAGKPVFSEPNFYKMNVQESEMMSDDELDMEQSMSEKLNIKQLSQIANKLSQKASCLDTIRHTSVQQKLSLDDESESENIEDKIIELPVMESVTRGLWRSVSRSSRTVYVAEEVKEVVSEQKNASEEQQVEDLDESEEESDNESINEESDDEESDEELQRDIQEMKKIIKRQHISRASKYQQIIRESVEFSQEDLEASNKQAKDSVNEYESLKHDVIRILKHKIDKKNYKNTIKSSRLNAIKAMEDWCVGDSQRSLRKALKKAKKLNWIN